VKFLRDRKVRDVAVAGGRRDRPDRPRLVLRPQCLANMVKAGIAQASSSCGAISGIEVPFNLTGYKPSDTILALLWTGIVNTLLVSAVSIVVATVIGFTCRIAAAVAQLAAVEPGRFLTSSSCATSRCCSSCCSGISACSPPCRRRATA
jgi:hypothetical protein